MKRILLLSISLLVTGILMAGGIVTNQNQSAQYIRTQARDATLGIDAVFYNPAGLTLLPNNGFFLSLNNQSLSQERKITTDYKPPLKEDTYYGNIKAPLFPGIYAAYKIDNWAFSLGFNPIGGGGGGTYDKGLPSFEYPIADLVPALQSQGQPATDYRMDAYFEGTSAYFGYQANVSYKINDMIQVALGVRYVSAKESYKGYLRDVGVNMGGTWVPAHAIMTDAADQFRPGLTGTTDIVSAGYGSLTFEEAETAGVIDATQRAQLEGGIVAMGEDPTDMTIETAQSYYDGTVSGYDAKAVILNNQDAEYEKTATGITPIISINIKASDKLNLALKYEHNTPLEFKNSTTSDFKSGFNPITKDTITEFPDGAITNNDIPALLVVGATYKPFDRMLISTGIHYYFDKNANWDGREKELDGNSWEFGLGVEYKFTEKFLGSIGYLHTHSYPIGNFQSDLDQSMPSNTIGAGVAYQVLPMMDINLSGAYVSYFEGSKNFEYDFAQTGTLIPIQETYLKPIYMIALGLNFNFSAGK